MRPAQRPTRSELLARMPRAFRPRLDALQRRDLALCHVVNLDAIATGSAAPGILWDIVGGTLMWHRAAVLLGTGVPEMSQQMEMATRLVERYARTGVVRFDGPDYQLAKIGLQVMDELATLIDRPTAVAAADWSELEVSRIAADVDARRAEQLRAAA
jgi:hypothetical protein